MPGPGRHRGLALRRRYPPDGGCPHRARTASVGRCELVTFCGSAGERSANQALLDVIDRVAVDRGWTVVAAGDLDGIPMFDPAVGEDAAPRAVTMLRNSFETADAVVFAIPEYGGGAAGWAKNALDWMVGSGSLHDRIAAVVCAGTTGGRARSDRSPALAWQGAHVVAALGVAAPVTKRDDRGRIIDESTLGSLTEIVGFLSEASEDEVRRRELTTETLGRLGIPLSDRTRA
ncbi:MAG: NAD(P)H-dependent oxidoreductase [Microthrixaceae bacterium]